MATMYPVSQLHPSPTNPRKIRDAAADAELFASVKEHGILSSLLVRPRAKGGHEVVLGARRLEAARAAKLGEVPAELRADLDDEKVRELQIVENGQRADVHPLDEADSYKVLVDEYRRDADWIAAHIHKTVAHVRRRLQLVKLGDDGRKAWLAGQISEDAAFVLARVPAQLQKAALEVAVDENTPDTWGEKNGEKFDTVSGQDMRHIVRSTTTLPIAGAPFDASDSELVKKAGSCTGCPKRTGSQPALFEDLSAKDDLCTDPPCYRSKCDARWAAVQIEAKASKGKVRILSAADTKKLYPYAGSMDVAYGSDWIELDADARALFTPETMPPVAYAQRPDGMPVVLVAKADYGKAKKAHEKTSAAAGGKGSSSSSSSGVSAKQKEKLKLERAAQKKADAVRLFTARRIVGAIVASAEKSQLDDSGEMLALVTIGLEHAHDATLSEIAARRGLSLEDVATGKKVDAHEAISRYAATAKGDITPLCGLLVELMIGNVVDESVEQLAKAFRVNVAAIRSTAEKELDRLAEQTHTKLPGKAAARAQNEQTRAAGEAAKKSDAAIAAAADRMGKPASAKSEGMGKAVGKARGGAGGKGKPAKGKR